MAVRILSVLPDSIAAASGISPGDAIVSINGEPILDEIDYQALVAESKLTLVLSNPDGREHTLQIRKKSWEPLGLCLDETEALKPRHCRNHCLFCFIDQLPKGMRPSLYVKDDDWRLSLMMGNYVTLTNVDDQEFDRMLRRRASPLYISVHATDPEVRVRLLRNPHAGLIMDRLLRLKDNGIQFHSQIVLCPGINDGPVLEKTIRDLSSLWPSAQSVAVVPIGMTRHREHLPQMKAFSPKSASALIAWVSQLQEEFLSTLGTRFVFLSDEFYCLAASALPEDAAYEDYSQIENGVGMIRLLEEECEQAYRDLIAEAPVLPEITCRHILIPTGVSVRPYLENLVHRYAHPRTEVEVIAVKNRFFGESITVTGLIVGQDLLAALEGKNFDRVLISENMLRENSDRFLDDMTLEEVRRAVGKPLVVVGNNGESLIRALYEMEEKHEQ